MNKVYLLNTLNLMTGILSKTCVKARKILPVSVSKINQTKSTKYQASKRNLKDLIYKNIKMQFFIIGNKFEYKYIVIYQSFAATTL